MAKSKDKEPNSKKAQSKKAAGGKAAQPEKRKPGRAPKERQKVSEEELAALRRPVEEAKAKFEAARKEADVLETKAKAVVAEAKDGYHAALAPYREACRKAKVRCEYEGGRTASVSEKVSFLVEKVEKGIRVMVKGRPDSVAVIPLAALKESVQKAAQSYTEAQLGPREAIGNKAGSLYNRLRAVMA